MGKGRIIVTEVGAGKRRRLAGEGGVGAQEDQDGRSHRGPAGCCPESRMSFCPVESGRLKTTFL